MTTPTETITPADLRIEHMLLNKAEYQAVEDRQGDSSPYVQALCLRGMDKRRALQEINAFDLECSLEGLWAQKRRWA